MRLLSPYRKQNAKVSRLLTNFFSFLCKIYALYSKNYVLIRKIVRVYSQKNELYRKSYDENKLIGLSYFPDLNAIKLKCFICNCFHSKYNLCDFYFVLLLVSMVKLSNHKIHPPHWFQCCT